MTLIWYYFNLPFAFCKIKVEKVLNEEKGRVSAYLNSESETKLLHVLDKELLESKEQVCYFDRLRLNHHFVRICFPGASG